MWDYGAKRPMPVNLMEKQCETGLQWLQEGRIEGMIFLASCICDLGLETVEWTRGVGGQGRRPATVKTRNGATKMRAACRFLWLFGPAS